VVNLTSSGGEEGLVVSTRPLVMLDAAGFIVFTGRLEPEHLSGRILATNVTTFREDLPGFSTGIGYGGGFDLAQVPCE
jgi:hypothetical protein